MMLNIGMIWVVVLSVYASERAMETNTLFVKQVNKDGFGDRTNQYAFAMESFRGSLYVATLNAENPFPGMALFFAGLPFATNGVEIHKGTRQTNGTWLWTNVVTNGNGNTHNYGMRKLREIGQYMYGVTANHISGCQVWRTSDGSTWNVIVSGGFGDVENTSGRGLLAYKGYLYVGVENRRTGAKIWRREITEDGDFETNSDWEEVVKDGLGYVLNYWFSDFVQYKGWMYIGTLNPRGMQLWRTKNGNDFEKIFDNGNGNPFEHAVMKLYVYGGTLYFGTMNFYNGASLWRSIDNKGTQFETIFTDGNGNRNNAYVWYMHEFRGRLYLGTFKTFGEFDLLSSAKPGKDAFVIETDTGFGNQYQYGIRTMTIHDDKFIIGSATARPLAACQVYEADQKKGSGDKSEL